MGSKIPEAKLIYGDKITALAYEKRISGELYCSSYECDAKLSFVKRHLRSYDGKTIEILPCFRLKKGGNHQIDCKYNISGQLSIIAKSSESEVFSALAQSKYEFRLHILSNALGKSVAVNSEKRIGSEIENEQSENKNKEYSNKGKLSNYLKSMCQILELRSLCQDNEELKKLVVLKFNNKKISWDKFYFNHDNLGDFTKTYGINKLTPPLAIAGLIYRDIQEPTDKFPFHSLKLEASTVSDEHGIVRTVVPQVILKESSLQHQINLKVGTEYIFFGHWKAKINENRGRVFENISIYIEHQDCVVEC